MAEHAVRSGHHGGHFYGGSGDRLRALPACKQREPRRPRVQDQVSRCGAFAADAQQGRGLPVEERHTGLVFVQRQRVQLHRLVQTGALDQRCAHVRDQRPGGEVQREELRAVPAGGGSPGGQIWHAGPHVDSTRGGDRRGDTGPGEPDGGPGGVAEPAKQDVQPQGEHRRARPRAAGPLAATAEESPAGYA